MYSLATVRQGKLLIAVKSQRRLPARGWAASPSTPVKPHPFPSNHPPPPPHLPANPPPTHTAPPRARPAGLAGRAGRAGDRCGAGRRAPLPPTARQRSDRLSGQAELSAPSRVGSGQRRSVLLGEHHRRPCPAQQIALGFLDDG